MKEKFSKLFNVIKRDGLVPALKKTYTHVKGNYYNKINVAKKISYNKQRKEIIEYVTKAIKNGRYDRIIFWVGSFGWNVPLFQRPQHIARCLSDEKCLIFYEVTRMTDPEVKFIKKQKNNLYLVNYEIDKFVSDLFDIVKDINKPKYMQIYSTCWNVKETRVKKFTENGFKIIYEYIDEISPELSGTDMLPVNIKDMYDYSMNNKKDVLVITTASSLYDDVVSKRGKTNLVSSSNGVDYEHFTKINKKVKVNENISKIIKQNKPTICYYGALASWFDYDLLKQVANKRKDINFVLIGVKYDTSFDDSNISRIDNVYYVDPIPYIELPSNVTNMDMFILPFKINDITLSTNPIKVFEYMAMEKPIISTPLPECKKYKSVKIANNVEEFVNCIDLVLKNDNNKNYKKLLKKEALINTWENKALDIIKGLNKMEGK